MGKEINLKDNGVAHTQFLKSQFLKSQSAAKPDTFPKNTSKTINLVKEEKNFDNITDQEKRDVSFYYMNQLECEKNNIDYTHFQFPCYFTTVSIARNIDTFPIDIHLKLLKRQDTAVEEKIRELSTSNKEFNNNLSQIRTYEEELGNCRIECESSLDKVNNKIDEINNFVLKIDELNSKQYLDFSGTTSECVRERVSLQSQVSGLRQKKESALKELNPLLEEYNKQTQLFNGISTKIFDLKNNLREDLCSALDFKMMESIKSQLDELKTDGQFDKAKVLGKYPKLSANVFFDTMLYNLENNIDIKPGCHEIASELALLRRFVSLNMKNGCLSLVCLQKEIINNPHMYPNLNSLIENHIEFPLDGQDAFGYANKKSNDNDGLPYPSIDSYHMAYYNSSKSSNSSENSFLKSIFESEFYDHFISLGGSRATIVAYIDKCTEIQDEDIEKIKTSHFDPTCIGNYSDSLVMPDSLKIASIPDDKWKPVVEKLALQYKLLEKFIKSNTDDDNLEKFKKSLLDPQFNECLGQLIKDNKYAESNIKDCIDHLSLIYKPLDKTFLELTNLLLSSNYFKESNEGDQETFIGFVVDNLSQFLNESSGSTSPDKVRNFVLCEFLRLYVILKYSNNLTIDSSGVTTDISDSGDIMFEFLLDEIEKMDGKNRNIYDIDGFPLVDASILISRL